MKELFQKYKFRSPDHFSILRLILLYVLPIMIFFLVGNLLVITNDMAYLLSVLQVVILESLFGFVFLLVPVGTFAVSVELMAISKKVNNGAFFVFVSGLVGMVTFICGVSYHDGTNPIQAIMQTPWFALIMFVLHSFVAFLVYRKKFYYPALL